MNVTHEQARNILQGNQAFSQLGFSMLLTRLKGMYAKDPSQCTLQTCTNEINAFLEKFKAIMAQDFALISKM